MEKSFEIEITGQINMILRKSESLLRNSISNSKTGLGSLMRIQQFGDETAPDVV